jgi:hypothetical protein
MKSSTMLSSEATTIACHAAVVISARAAALRLCEALPARLTPSASAAMYGPGAAARSRRYERYAAVLPVVACASPMPS